MPLDQDMGQFPIPPENAPEYGVVVRIQGSHALLTADKDGTPTPFLRHNEQMLVRYTPHIEQLISHGWADLIDYLEYPAASQYFPTMAEVFGMIEDRAKTLPGEKILGLRVDGSDLVMSVGRDLEASREVRATIPQLKDMSEEVRQAEDAAERSELALEQLMGLVKDAAQYAADQVTIEASEYAAISSAAAERSLEYAERARQEVQSIGTVVGPAGPPGPQGERGPAGATGGVGPAGPQGVKGATGAQGPQGLKGDTGPAGPQGLQGPKGDKGDIGSQGPKGDTGPAGPQGIEGPKGAVEPGVVVPLPRGTIDLSSKLTGTSAGSAILYYNGGIAELRLWDLTCTAGGTTMVLPASAIPPEYRPVNWRSFALVNSTVNDYGRFIINANGSVSAAGVNADAPYYGSGAYALERDVSAMSGPAGQAGPQGVQGATGAAGPQGLKGDTGPQGPKGDTGSVGPAGPQGLQGDKGATGDTGPAGPQGIQGAKGATGATGATGPKGDKGDTGAVGPKGDTGPQGLQGPKGDTGATGLPGADGRGLVMKGEVATAASLPTSAAVGDTYVLTSTGKAVSRTASGTWSDPFAFVGPQGPQGLQGMRGDTGATGATGPKGDTGPAGSLNSAQLTELFGDSTNTRRPYGIMRWSGPAYNPAVGFMRLKRDSDGRLVTWQGYGNAAVTSVADPYLYAPVSGIYMLSATQTWQNGNGAKGCGLGSSLYAGDAGMFLWTDITTGIVAEGSKIMYLAAGQKLYPWTFTGATNAGMTGQIRDIPAEYSIMFMGKE